MSNRTKPASYYFIQFGFYGFVLLILAGILFSFSFIFITLFASAVFALLLEPVVNYWETRGTHRVLAILSIYVLIAAGLALLGAFLIPLLMYEVKNFAANLPAYGAMVHDMALHVQKSIKNQFPAFTLPDYYPYLKDRLFASLKTIMASVPALASSAASLASMALLIPFITFFLLADGHLFSKNILTLVPNRYFEMSVLLLHKAVDALKMYVRGQLIDSCAIMALTTVGYAIVGLPYFLVVGLVLRGLFRDSHYPGNAQPVVAVVRGRRVPGGPGDRWHAHLSQRGGKNGKPSSACRDSWRCRRREHGRDCGNADSGPPDKRLQGHP